MTAEKLLEEIKKEIADSSFVFKNATVSRRLPSKRWQSLIGEIIEGSCLPMDVKDHYRVNTYGIYQALIKSFLN